MELLMASRGQSLQFDRKIAFEVRRTLAAYGFAGWAYVDRRCGVVT